MICLVLFLITTGLIGSSPFFLFHVYTFCVLYSLLISFPYFFFCFMLKNIEIDFRHHDNSKQNQLKWQWDTVGCLKNKLARNRALAWVETQLKLRKGLYLNSSSVGPGASYHQQQVQPIPIGPKISRFKAASLCRAPRWTAGIYRQHCLVSGFLFFPAVDKATLTAVLQKVRAIGDVMWCLFMSSGTPQSLFSLSRS